MSARRILIDGRLHVIEPESAAKCGKCPGMVADWSTMRSADRCTLFDELVDFVGGSVASGGYYARLAKCRTAERKAKGAPALGRRG